LTDVLTTDISMYTQRGGEGFAMAIGLAIVLLLIVFGINLIIMITQKARMLFDLGRMLQ